MTDAPGLALLAMLLILACLLSAVLALALAAAALVRPPGRWWAFAAAGWMVGASFLWYANAQEALWTPLGGGPEDPAAESAQYDQGPPSDQQGASGMGWAEPEEVVEGEGMAMEEPFPPITEPPPAYLTSARRDATGLEGTYCWAPEWAPDCVEDAGIPLPDERETLAIRQGEAADLVFALRGSEAPPAFFEEEPIVEGAVAYPLEQEAKTVPDPSGLGYLVPDGGSRALEKEEVGLREGEEAGVTKVVADVPEGEYVFQVSARPREGADSSPWAVANYHYRVRVLPGKDPTAGEAP